jgi:asparagine synthase (glutamine-hydrolysing)
MCGITGCLDLRREGRIDEGVLRRMTAKLTHRGPDSDGYLVDDQVALGFRRLSIVDLEGGAQPMRNEDETVSLVCNGEIFNYPELRARLTAKGHVLRSRCDVEVLVHLYEERGTELCTEVNGQFAFALYDHREEWLMLARDPFGINPLFFTVTDGLLIFGSEVKAILEHPAVRREVDLTGLDQILSFPGLVSPRTMFRGIESLKPGSYLRADGGQVQHRQYWDLDYPCDGKNGREHGDRDDVEQYVESLHELLHQSVKRRLQADVPVGFYLSGGLDSSLLARLVADSSDDELHSFSIVFDQREMNEQRFQQRMAREVGSRHCEIFFDADQVANDIARMTYFSEAPVKETYNTCTLALSAAARRAGVPVVLTGDGADELFAGYVGYRFDGSAFRRRQGVGLDDALEAELRERLWGNPDFFYEKDFQALGAIKADLYSAAALERFDDFDCLRFELVDKERLRGRHPLHVRSYLDFKLRLADHLLGDHGDRMSHANSVESRFPFLDVELIDFATTIPPELKLGHGTEKYLLRRVAERLVPREIREREKFGWYAPGSPYLLRQGIEWINDMLSYDAIARSGYFNPDTVESMKHRFSEPGFRINAPYEDDYLLIVLTFNVFLEAFQMPELS